MKTSVVWIDGENSYAFMQVVNPGPSVLTELDVPLTKIRGRVDETIVQPVSHLRAWASLSGRESGQRSPSAEFQKILDHRGIVLNQPIGALAHLGLARAYAIQGDTAKAKVAHQNFLTQWKDADPDIPILKEANAEFAKLH